MIRQSFPSFNVFDQIDAILRRNFTHHDEVTSHQIAAVDASTCEAGTIMNCAAQCLLCGSRSVVHRGFM